MFCFSSCHSICGRGVNNLDHVAFSRSLLRVLDASEMIMEITTTVVALRGTLRSKRDFVVEKHLGGILL